MAFAPAAERNKEPIRKVLADVLPSSGVVLEVASGTGQHAIYFSQSFPDLTWQPSDVEKEALESIQKWAGEAGCENLNPPLFLDVTTEWWPDVSPVALVASNLIHIAPWEACLGLFRGAASSLPLGAPLILYGPYFGEGAQYSESNETFDASLRQRDPTWGVRRIEDVKAVAQDQQFQLERRVAMPANNMTLVFRKKA